MRDISTNEYDRAINSADVVVVDFWAPWCVKCPPMMEMVEQVEKRFPPVPFFKVDVETEVALKDFAKIKAIPMVVLYKKGRPRDFLFGVPDEEKLTKKILTLIGV
jgi:thiol-disulfide isomerase/thioredoxin